MMSVVLPLSMSSDAASCDQSFRNVTFHFGLYSLNVPFDDPRAATFSDTIHRAGRLPGAFCARSGNYFPGERLRIDAYGRTVGAPFYTSRDPLQERD
jgi:hypothetical protein